MNGQEAGASYRSDLIAQDLTDPAAEVVKDSGAPPHDNSAVDMVVTSALTEAGIDAEPESIESIVPPGRICVRGGRRVLRIKGDLIRIGMIAEPELAKEVADADRRRAFEGR